MPPRRLLSFICVGMLLFAVRAQANEGLRLAVLGDTQQAAADLLLVELAKSPEIVLVERQEIEKIAAEKQLSFAGLTNDQAITMGRLLHADGLVLLRNIGANIQVVLIAVQSGAILFSFDRSPADEPIEALTASVSAQVLKALPKFALKEKDVTKLSVLNFRTLRGDIRLGPPFTKMLTAMISDSPDFVVLEREELRTVSKEKGMAAEQQPFWASSYLVRGTMEGDPKDEKLLRVNVEIVPPNQPRGEVYTVEGTRDDIAGLARRGAQTVSEHFQRRRAPLAADWKERESEYFLREADIAFRNLRKKEAWTMAYTAWSLGLRDPRLAEILMLLHLEKDGRGSFSGDFRSAHNQSNIYSSAEVLRERVHLASRFEHNPRYWRGMPEFWFPEGLDEVEDLVEYYRAFSRAAETDSRLRQVDSEGRLAVEIMLAASLPHLLICREPDAGQFTGRLSTMARDLDAFYDELLRSNISQEQKEYLIKIHAAMTPFTHDGDLTAAIRELLNSYPRDDQFGERAAARAGLMTGFYLSTQYARNTDKRFAFFGLKDELLASANPEDRLIGEYIGYYDKSLPKDDWVARGKIIEKIFEHLRAIDSQAYKAPHGLGTYLLEVWMLFDEEDWTNRNLRVKGAANYTDGNKEALVNNLTRRTARKFLLTFLDHWPAGYPSRGLTDITGPFFYWANGPGVTLKGANMERVPERDPEDIKSYYLPLVERYRKERASSEPNKAKLDFLSGPYSMVSKYWPELLPESERKAEPPKEDGRKLMAHAKWSLKREISKALGHDVDEVKPLAVKQDKDVLYVVGAAEGACFLFNVNLLNFTTTELRVPIELPDGDESEVTGFVDDGNYLYLLSSKPPLIQFNRRTGKSRVLAHLSANSGFALNGKFYFANNKEFYSLSPENDNLEVLASLDRTPAASPLDDQEFEWIGAVKSEEGTIRVSGRREEGGRVVFEAYSFDPESKEWRRIPDDEQAAKQKYLAERRLRAVVARGRLMYAKDSSSTQDLMRKGVSVPIDFEGTKNNPAPFALGMGMFSPVCTTEGVVLLTRRGHFESDFRLWYLKFSEIEEFIKTIKEPKYGIQGMP